VQNAPRQFAAPMMHGIVKDLTPAEIQAVAAYVQSK
jgi:mono/diheme cytochrome c family protein